MADDKRKRNEQQQGGDQGPDRPRRGDKERQPGSVEAPGSGRARNDDAEEQQE